MMKTLRITLVLLTIGCVFAAVVLAADTTLKFKDFEGPTEIQFGPVYTYSVVAEGSYDSDNIKWSATGGKVIKTWWEDNEHFCEVQWYENDPDDPAKLKVWGEDKGTGEIVDARLPVTVKAQTRGLDYKSLRNKGGKCLDVHIEDLVKDGGRVQIWECNNATQQRWKFDDQGRLVNEGGKCLEVQASDLEKDGGKVQTQECNDAVQQKWKLDKKGRLVNGGGKCLDIHLDDVQKDGGKVQVWECHEMDNQRWTLVE